MSEFSGGNVQTERSVSCREVDHESNSGETDKDGAAGSNTLVRLGNDYGGANQPPPQVNIVEAKDSVGLR